MSEFIMVGCDLHDKTMLLKVACDRGPAETMSVRNTRTGRTRMIADLKAWAKAAGGASILFAYEASGQGFGLYDELILPLHAGDNQVWIAVSEDFGGWGVLMQLPDVDRPEVIGHE
jgi:hypothetical protein